jgi:hypothetical protein
VSHPGSYPTLAMGAVGQPERPAPLPETEPFPKVRERLLTAPERSLFYAYRNTHRGCVCCRPNPEKCACGATIAPDSVADIPDAVERHNSTRPHRLWRET